MANDILYKSLVDSNTVEVVEGKGLDFNALNPMRTLVEELTEFPEVDYDEYSDLIFDLFDALFKHLGKKFTEDEIKNIVMFNKKDIARKIYTQMKQHFECDTPDIVEQIYGVSYNILDPSYITKKGQEPISLYAVVPDGEVPKQLYNDMKKALHPIYKFDSEPERKFAIVCESSPEVLKWLRPAPKQFNLMYGNNQRYEPDFVVETNDTMYLVEIKGEDKLNAEENLQKKARAIRYCELANIYCEQHGLKYWKYLYIPSKQVQTNSSFTMLAQRFEAKE